MASRTLTVKVVGDESDLLRSFKKSEKAARGFSGSTQKASRSITKSVLGVTGAFIGTAGLAAAARSAFSEMAEAQKVTAKTRAVLKSTGGVANVTAKHVDKLGDQLLRVSGVDDELIKNSENVLLTFKRIRNETGKGNQIFDEATKATLDLSVALGKDLQSSAILVGKALNDPTKGLGALQRVGIQFTLEQKKLIKGLDASGHTLEAQKLILKELNSEFGGAARAVGGTLPGKLNILRETLLNLGATIAEKLAPSLTKLVDKIVTWLNKSENQERILKAVDDAASALADTFRILKGAFDRLNSITGSTKRSLELLLAAFIAFKTAKIIGMLAAIVTQTRLIGTASVTSAGQVTLLQGRLAGLARFAVIPIAIKLVDDATGKHIADLNLWIYEHITRPIGNALNKLVPGNPFGGSQGGRGPKASVPVGLRGPAGMNINGPITVVANDPREFERQLQREARRRSGSRRGPNAGNSLGVTG